MSGLPRVDHAGASVASTEAGVLVISIDVERFWGLCGFQELQAYAPAIEGERAAILDTLELFRAYQVEATWAVLGYLFFPDAAALIKSLPERQPRYRRSGISTYDYIDLASRADCHRYFFLTDELDRIGQTRGQEIGSHSFSHIYCLQGPDVGDFRADTAAFSAAASRFGVKAKSYVFPQNQYNPAFAGVLREFGYSVFRGTEASAMYRSDNLVARSMRYADAILPLSGDNTYRLPRGGSTPGELSNVPSSRFLRPLTGNQLIDELRLRRIIGGIRRAARHGEIFHLWWHPHNFGRNPRDNVARLERILREYANCAEEYGMLSMNMGRLGEGVA